MREYFRDRLHVLSENQALGIEVDSRLCILLFEIG